MTTFPHCKICGGGLETLLENIFDDRHGYPGRYRILRCTACGLGQTLPEIPPDQVGEIYTRYYPRKSLVDVAAATRRRVQIPPFAKRWLLGINNTAHYHIKKGARVLDVGCGDCTSILEIQSLGAEGYGIEPDRNIKELVDTLQLKVHIGLFHEVPYPVDFFDFITMSQVLEHVHDPVTLVASFRRILKKDGQLIIGVPNIDSRLRKRYGSRWLNWHVPYHLNHFSRKSLEVLAERSGYEVASMATYTPNLWVDLQTRLANYPLREGVRVPFLNGEAETEEPSTSQPPQTRVERFINDRLSHLRQFLQIILLRMVDLAGGGESHLIFLRKKRS